MTTTTPRAAAVAGSGSVIGDRLEVLALLLTGYACDLHYNLVGHLASLRGVDFGPYLLTPLDRALPYAPWGVWFYQLAYVMPAAVVLLVAAKIGADAPAFRRILIAAASLVGLHYLLYLTVPASGHSIRMAGDALGSGLTGELVGYQYRLASVWNAWPSLHVSGCWFFGRLLARHYPFLQWAYFAWFLGMLWGAFAIKIHYVLDGLAGIVIGEAVYRLLLLRLERNRSCRWVWRSTAQRVAVHLAILVGVLGLIPLLMRLSGFAGSLLRPGQGG